MRFRHSVIAQNEAVTADTLVSYDLPVNPLSHVFVTLKFAQNGADTQLSFANVLAMLDSVEVLYKGSPIFSMSGLDAFACGLYICGFESWGLNDDGTDDDERSITFLVPMGRKLYNPEECFPSSRRGELSLQLGYATSFTEIDSVRAQVEAVELPEAGPESFLKMTTLAVTPGATGQYDIELPIGNLLSDVVLFGTTFPTGSADTATLNFLELLLDNQEIIYTGGNYETLHNMAGRIRPAPGYWGYHVHQLDDASFAQYMDTSAVKAEDHVLKQHLHLPIDIHRDGQFILDTKGASNLVCRIDVGSADAIRVIPCEIVASGEGV